MEIKIRGYRAIERADIDFERIALVAGRNEQGKSSIAQAVAAVLTGIPIVVPGVAKKDAKVLVREGADDGIVLLTDDKASRTIQYPKCDVSGLADEKIGASELACGLGHVFDMKPDDRARLLGAYIKAVPTQDDVYSAVLDIGYHEETAARVWKAVSAAGSSAWDATWIKAKEWGTKEKGKWEGITGEAYGSKKAADWKPANLPAETDRDVLVDRANAAKQRYDAAVAGAAVSQAEIERLKQQVEEAGSAEDVVALKADLETQRAELEAKRRERAGMPSEVGVHTKNEVKPCPSCGTALVIERLHNEPTKLTVYDRGAADKAEKHDNRRARAQLDGTIEGLKAAIATLEGRYEKAKRLVDDGMSASERLEEIGDNSGSNQDAIEMAKQGVEDAVAALKAFDDKTKADELHAQIAKNERLIALLAPDGLRRRTLAKALDGFNGALAEVSAAAGWPTVRFDESLSPHYGTRPVWAASKSGQWRARVVVQLVLAKLDNSAAVVIDDAEILIDAKSRGGLIEAIKLTGLRALVCMAFAKPDTVPNLERAGLGRSYWIEAGVAQAL